VNLLCSEEEWLELEGRLVGSKERIPYLLFIYFFVVVIYLFIVNFLKD
jgi:hypothetical protein